MAEKDIILDMSDVQQTSSQGIKADIVKGHSASDQLQFQDIAHDDHSDEPPGAKVQTHTFTNFPDPAEEEEDDSQQANLLKGEKKQASFWTFEYYQGYFDVDTHQVLRRILGSIVPNPKSNYLEQHIRPSPDLYGPFWICTTLVFTTAIAGNMANYFQQSGKDYQWQYDFHKVTFAATAIFGYWWLLPTLLYALLWWRGSQSNYLFSEILCVYGYSLAIYIPISILWVIQITWLQWLLVMMGMVFSGSVLVLTFWPALKQEDKKIAFLALGLIILFHGLLAIGFVMYFFHVPAQVVVPGITTAATVLSNGTAAPVLMAGGAIGAGIPGSASAGQNQSSDSLGGGGQVAAAALKIENINSTSLAGKSGTENQVLPDEEAKSDTLQSGNTGQNRDTTTKPVTKTTKMSKGIVLPKEPVKAPE